MKLVELAAIMGLASIGKKPNRRRGHSKYSIKVRPKDNPVGTKLMRLAEKCRLGCWSAR